MAEPVLRRVQADVVEQPCDRCGGPVPVSIYYAGRRWGRRGPQEQAVTCSASCRTLLSRDRVARHRVEYERERDAELRRDADYARLPDRHVERGRATYQCAGCAGNIPEGAPSLIRSARVDGVVRSRRYCGAICVPVLAEAQPDPEAWRQYVGGYSDR